jgi:hypothetical protein
VDRVDLAEPVVLLAMADQPVEQVLLAPVVQVVMAEQVALVEREA